MEVLPVVRYLVVCLLLTALGAPIAAVLFDRLPGKGAAFSLPTALIPFAIVAFWVGQVTFGYLTLVFAVLVLLAGATLALQFGVEPDWRRVLETYGIFVVGFLLLVVFRSSAPAITQWDGEQFLHFGMLNALERAPKLPPEDLWYAGKTLKYYYGTQLQVASLAMLSGTEMRYGFNLGIAAFYGVLFVTAYGIASAIAERRGYPRRLVGGLGTFFAAVAGPTTTFVRLATPHLPEGIRGTMETVAFGFVANRFNGGNLAATVAERSAYQDWSWWYTRYVVPGTIQEVPLYSFVKGDLHGHALSTGYVLFAAAIGYAYYATPVDDRRRRTLLVFGGLGSLAGVFGFMNTWSLPTAGGIAMLAVAAADAHPATLLPESYASMLDPTSGRTTSGSGRVAAEIWRLVLAAIVGGIVVAIGVVIASPFLVFGDIPSNNGIGLLPPRSPIGPFLVIYSGVLALAATYVLARAVPVLERQDRGVLLAVAVTVLSAMVVLTVVVDFAVLALIGPIVVGGWLLVRSDRAGYAAILVIAGLGLLVSFELLHAKLPEIRNPRWNTSLKVAVQGWTLAAAGAGTAAGMLLADARSAFARSQSPADRATGDDGDQSDTSDRSPSRIRQFADRTDLGSLGAVVVSVVVALAVVTSVAFPVMVFGQEVGSDVVNDDWQPTLDGHSYIEDRHPQEAEAIAWLDDVDGTPTIVEAPGHSYGWTSPASVFTGLPAVIGWDHQTEYRSPAKYERRVNAVDTIYAGDWTNAAANLSRYDVRYVYVGPNEVERYGQSLRAFDHDAFTPVFENAKVTIYAVDKSELPGSSGSNATRTGGTLVTNGRALGEHTREPARVTSRTRDHVRSTHHTVQRPSSDHSRLREVASDSLHLDRPSSEQ